MPRVLASLLLLILVVAAAPARAYTPESGVWWNPAEPGTGLIIEIQDNFVAVAAFVGDAAGNPIWYTATGFLSGNARFDGVLDFFPGAQCIGCNYRAPTLQGGAGGPIRIVFDADDPARATLTWGGRTRAIERFRFYFKRPEDEQRLPGVSAELTRLMGEWQAVLDFSSESFGDGTYFGEVLIFDNLDSDNLGDYVDGCRPAESLAGLCTQADLDTRYAVAEYIASSDTHVIVVENSASTFASYFIELGSNAFSGEVSVYNRGSEPTSFFPVRGFRSASRSFVEEGVGPSRKASARASAGLPETGNAGRTWASDKAARVVLEATRARLQGELEARRGTR